MSEAMFDPAKFSFRAVLSGASPRPPIAAFLGWEFIGDEGGVLVLRFPPRPEFENPAGNIHGGILTAMLDECMSGAASLPLPDNAVVPTIDMTVRFIRPARGELRGAGRLIHRGQRICHTAGELHDAGGRLVASATASCMIALPGT